MPKIFFSYSRTDGSDFALRLALDLKKKGFDAWIDQEDIRAGSEWDLEIEKALQTCDCLLFIETEKSVASNNVLDEVYYALEQHKKVIPLIFIDSKTPFRLQRLQHISFTKDYDSGLSLLINELERINSAATIQPEESRPIIKVDRPFYAKYSRLILLIAAIVIIIAAATIYTAKDDNVISTGKTKVVNSDDTINDDKTLADIEPKAPLKKDTAGIGMNEKKLKTTGRNQNVVERDKEIVSTTGKNADLHEIVTGNWELVDVNPKARLKRGYMKIEPIDEKRVTIKSHLQFYYFKTNETSFLVVFNAFAGCSSCNLAKDMKITVEDVAIGSQFIKILKEDQADGKKAGDTIMDAGFNQSIHASMSLHLIDNQTAEIKVQQPVSIALAEGLILEPFVYTFRLKKSD